MNGVGLRTTSVALKLYPFTGGFKILILVILKAPLLFTNSVVKEYYKSVHQEISRERELTSDVVSYVSNSDTISMVSQSHGKPQKPTVHLHCLVNVQMSCW